MEREEFISGYCRALDCSRMGAVCIEDRALTECGCGYESCPHRPSCLIAQRIREMLE